MNKKEESKQREFISKVLNHPQFLAYLLKQFVFELKKINRLDIPKYIKEIADLHREEGIFLNNQPIGNAYLKELLQSNSVLLEVNIPNTTESIYCAFFVEASKRNDWMDDPISRAMDIFNCIYYNHGYERHRKKVYVLGICMDHEMDFQRSIVLYTLKPDPSEGQTSYSIEQSPMNIYMVFPNEDCQDEHVKHLMKLLIYSFSDQLIEEDKQFLLKKRYAIDLETDTE